MRNTFAPPRPPDNKRMTGPDDLIARALCEVAPWPLGLDANRLGERAIYQGVTGLLMARAAHLADWPKDLHLHLHAEALAQTMWEVRHRSILTPLLAAQDAEDITAVIATIETVAPDGFVAQIG